MDKSNLSAYTRLKADILFEVLTERERNILKNSSVTHLYHKGQVVFREGAIPNGIYYVQAGRVKKYKITSKGREQIFYLCGEGELLGYHALLGEETYPDSVATTEDSEITFIPGKSFLQVLESSAALSNTLLKAMGHEFSLFITTITNLGTKTARERIAFNLLVLHEKFGKQHQPADVGTDIQISRADLANIVGTAKETLIRVLQDFTSMGLIQKTDRQIRILDREGMIREANLSGLR